VRLVARIVDGQRRIGELLRSRESAAFHLYKKKQNDSKNNTQPTMAYSTICRIVHHIDKALWFLIRYRERFIQVGLTVSVFS
jgi:hypothetical protein